MSTATERSLRASIASHTSWAKTEDRSQRTSAARAALNRKFLDEADGDPVRAEHLRKAYYKRLALKSVASRRKASELLVEADTAEAELRAGGQVA